MLVNVYVVLPLSISMGKSNSHAWRCSEICQGLCFVSSACRANICQFCTNQEVTKVRRATVSDERCFLEDFTMTF